MYFVEQIGEKNSLSHHGILGMKWGVRRFQNKDGSLTAAGKRQRENGEKSSNGTKQPKEMSWRQLRRKMRRGEAYELRDKISNSKVFKKDLENAVDLMNDYGDKNKDVAKRLEKRINDWNRYSDLARSAREKEKIDKRYMSEQTKDKEGYEFNKEFTRIVMNHYNTMLDDAMKIIGVKPSKKARELVDHLGYDMTMEQYERLAKRLKYKTLQNPWGI